MNVRLGSTSISLPRYLLLWSAVVLVFAVQHSLSDALHGDSWPFLAHLRWAMIQWLTWAALAPLVFRLAERYPIDPTRRLLDVDRQPGPDAGGHGGELALLEGLALRAGDAGGEDALLFEHAPSIGRPGTAGHGRDMVGTFRRCGRDAGHRTVLA